MALATLRLRDASEDDLDVVSTTTPGCLATLTTCCSTAHNFLPSLFSPVNHRQGITSIGRSIDLALEHRRVLNQRDCHSLTMLVFCRYDRLRGSTFFSPSDRALLDNRKIPLGVY